MSEGQTTEVEDQRLLTLVGCIRGLVLELDGEARYLNAWADDPALLAKPHEQTIGHTINEVLGEAAGAVFTAVVKRVFATGETEHIEYPLETDGVVRWFFADVKRVNSRSAHTVVMFAREITERKRGEEALRLSEERYRLAAQATNDVLYDWHVPSGVVTWSATAETILVVPTIDPSIDWWWTHIHPEDLERVRESMRRALDGGDASWSSGYRFRRGDGSYADMLDRGFVVREGGKPVRMVGSMADVTKVNRMQAQLLQADRLAAIGVLAAGVGHEINNPLTYVVGNLDFALDTTPHGEELRDVLSEARDGALKIAEIVKSLRLFSRNDPSEQSDVRLEEVLEGSIRIAENHIRHHGHLVRSYSATPLVVVSESRLAQVSLNLLTNAAQAIVATDREHAEIRVSTGLDSRGRVFFSVADNGPGIPPELMDRIFDPFFTTKPVGAGTGIGLSVCLGIVQSMGGEIAVTSVPYVRTEFIVSLPLAVMSVASMAVPPAPLTPLPKRKATTLVIDDDVAVARYISRILKSDESAVTTVSSAKAALELLATGDDFDLILCDLMMPEMNGVELYEVLRAEYQDLLPRVFFMTGGAFTSEGAGFLASLPHPPLEKPMAPERLRALLATAHEQAHATA